MRDSGGNGRASTVPYWFHRSRSVPARHHDVEGVDVFDRPDGIARILVLNLDRQPGRWAQFEAEASRHRVGGGGTLLDHCERMVAVDGRSASIRSFPAGEVSGAYTLDDFYVADPQPMLAEIDGRSGIWIGASIQEMAVAQSHLRTWERVVDEGTTLVLEDDAEFLPGFGSHLGRLWADLPPHGQEPGFDLLYLSYRAVESGMRMEPYSASLVRPMGGLWFLSGYVLTRRGAARLLDALPIRGPVDQWMNHQLGRLEAFAASTPLILQRRQVRSDNSYSVVPVLQGITAATRTGVGRRAAGPSDDRSRRAGTAPDGRRAPVFAIGLNKTGTTSLHAALSILGYRSCHWVSDEFSAETSALIDAGAPLPFEAYTDVASVVERYEDLDRRYPSAAFILTVRDLDDWLASRARHVARNRAENAVSAHRVHGWVDDDPVLWRTERLMHHEAVLRYFKDRPEKLLVLDVCAGDGWGVICRFLDRPVPVEPFPHVDPLSPAALARRVTARPRPRLPRPERLAHDDYPWITETRPDEPARDRGGSFRPLFADGFEDLDAGRWVKLDDTYEGNLAVFRPGNVSIVDEGGLRLTLRQEACGDRSYTAGSVATADDRHGWFRYGRFEAEIRPARAPGVLSGLFLYRRDPWQEIDLEFLGPRTDHVLINVFYNPGVEGDRHNHGRHGTPALVDLGFDAADAFHHYAIEWDPDGIRWSVDGELVAARANAPTPVPHLPLRLFLNAWPIDDEALAGCVDPALLPVDTVVRAISVSSWRPDLTAIAGAGAGPDHR